MQQMFQPAAGHLRTSRNFISYPSGRNDKKNKVELEGNLEHLRRIQDVDRTWNFSLTTIAHALQKVNEDRFETTSIAGKLMISFIPICVSVMFDFFGSKYIYSIYMYIYICKNISVCKWSLCIHSR
jgi:hypothetical protein